MAFLLVGMFVICGNYYLILRHLWLRSRSTTQGSTSLLPLVGGCSCCVGGLLCPIPEVSQFYWLPLLLDPACGLILAGVVWLLVLSRSSKPS